MVTCEIKLFVNFLSLRRRLSEKNLISPHGNLPEIITKLYHKLIAAHEYFLTRSLLLK